MTFHKCTFILYEQGILPTNSSTLNSLQKIRKTLPHSFYLFFFFFWLWLFYIWFADHLLCAPTRRLTETDVVVSWKQTVKKPNACLNLEAAESTLRKTYITMCLNTRFSRSNFFLLFYIYSSLKGISKYLPTATIEIHG